MEYEYIRYVNGVDKRDTHKARKVVEEAIGKPLPSQAVIHHVNGDISNHNNSNLVACENEAYHGLLHRRTRALLACGYANWRKCWICEEYDDPKNLYVSPNGRGCWHRECHNRRYRAFLYLGGKKYR